MHNADGARCRGLLNDFSIFTCSQAIAYYKQDLRIAPHHADSWAALALIYSSQLEQILNVVSNAVKTQPYLMFVE